MVFKGIKEGCPVQAKLSIRYSCTLNLFSEAYKKADGMKIDGRRVVVDYERGRTQKSWLPRRLGAFHSHVNYCYFMMYSVTSARERAKNASASTLSWEKGWVVEITHTNLAEGSKRIWPDMT